MAEHEYIESQAGNRIPKIRPARPLNWNDGIAVSVVTLGCARNTVDSENLGAALVQGGASMVTDPAESDVVIINTCGFIAPAKKESRAVIADIVQLKETAGVRQVLVIGCLVEREAAALAKAFPEVDGFYPLNSIAELTADIGLHGACHDAKRTFTSTGHYAWLKISEGCDYRCSFCVIPFIRGRHRSRPISDIVDEAQRLVDHGVRELVLVAEDTAYYGVDLDDDRTLCDVLRALNRVDGLDWLRVMYLHPARTTRAMIETVAELDRVVPYLDMPMQHASTRMLKKMRRQSSRDMLYDLIAQMRTVIPDVALRTTLLVGYPGETDEDFAELEEFVRDVRFERLGVFTYSPERGAPGFHDQPRVPARIKRERRDRLMTLQQEIAQQQNAQLTGQTVQVLIDAHDPATGESIGRTVWDAPEVDNLVRIPQKVPQGEFCDVRITDTAPYELRGELLPLAELTST